MHFSINDLQELLWEVNPQVFMAWGGPRCCFLPLMGFLELLWAAQATHSSVKCRSGCEGPARAASAYWARETTFLPQGSSSLPGGEKYLQQVCDDAKVFCAQANVSFRWFLQNISLNILTRAHCSCFVFLGFLIFSWF